MKSLPEHFGDPKRGGNSRLSPSSPQQILGCKLVRNPQGKSTNVPAALAKGVFVREPLGAAANSAPLILPARGDSGAVRSNNY